MLEPSHGVAVVGISRMALGQSVNRLSTAVSPQTGSVVDIQSVERESLVIAHAHIRIETSRKTSVGRSSRVVEFGITNYGALCVDMNCVPGKVCGVAVGGVEHQIVQNHVLRGGLGVAPT